MSTDAIFPLTPYEFRVEGELYYIGHLPGRTGPCLLREDSPNARVEVVAFFTDDYRALTFKEWLTSIVNRALGDGEGP